MRSVADQLQADERAAVARLSPSQRVTLALELGARDLERFRLAQDPALDPGAAARELERRRQARRRPCRCLMELIG